MMFDDWRAANGDYVHWYYLSVDVQKCRYINMLSWLGLFLGRRLKSLSEQDEVLFF